MDKVIDFNQIKNKASEKDMDKDIDKIEAYMYSLYYKMAEGKLNMAEFTKEITLYMEENNISQDRFLKMQTKLMERYGLDTGAFEKQLKDMGLNNIHADANSYEKARKAMGFQEKYKERMEVKAVSTYYIKNEKNNVIIYVESENVILKSPGKIDLADLELNEFLCSYKKVLEDNSLKISICEDVKEYMY
ncbi:DUF3867 domain-containing protein [Clostridium gasigenes]|uniref:DUF3867 domain-containing protein n=1 Tax=Clostridium gasigenes TaxID=94869 RepID=UPI0014385D57|nr:DUF3867 domain-containing protein [Clostridium gasigenes]MBU3132257.1 DUF3867 domain-containing protein [Clostridium gasigenes]NKF06847.1 DUF3867 domain-containing protein [Clostridium gasigenes]QSW19884.1 DUF3867 domain-containing protein [Clostridium gasigenes]